MGSSTVTYLLCLATFFLMYFCWLNSDLVANVDELARKRDNTSSICSATDLCCNAVTIVFTSAPCSFSAAICHSKKINM